MRVRNQDFWGLHDRPLERIGSSPMAAESVADLAKLGVNLYYWATQLANQSDVVGEYSVLSHLVLSDLE